MNKSMCILCVYIWFVFTNIARTASLARNPVGLAALLQAAATYHETPLHNLNDVADLGVESSGTKKDRLQELEEILEDESQSPDEQSASKYEENVKVFDNPVVLEATSRPSDDEVKDFQKVRKHELATEDRHFDVLSTFISEPKLFDYVNRNLSKEKNKVEMKPAPPAPEPETDKVSSELSSQKPSPTTGPSSNSGSTPQPWHKPHHHTDNLKGTLDLLNLSSHQGVDNTLNSGLHNPLSSDSSGPLEDETQRNIFSKLPPVKVNANTRNHFHIFNVHHHYPQPTDTNTYPESLKYSQGFLSKECFEGTIDGKASGQHCYCSKSDTCRCTQSYMMLVSVCDTLVNDPFLKEFCSHHDVRRDHPKLNHRFARSKDNLVSEAFRTVHSALCNYKSFGHCKNVMEIDKLCQCTRCD